MIMTDEGVSDFEFKKGLLYICIILAACRMCLWISYWWKEEKAQTTQSNFNKNAPQQLTDKDLFGNETTLAVSEEDIQAALDGDEVPRSP